MRRNAKSKDDFDCKHKKSLTNYSDRSGYSTIPWNFFDWNLNDNDRGQGSDSWKQQYVWSETFKHKAPCFFLPGEVWFTNDTFLSAGRIVTPKCLLI